MKLKLTRSISVKTHHIYFSHSFQSSNLKFQREKDTLLLNWNRIRNVSSNFLLHRSKSFRFESARTFYDRPQEKDALLVGMGLRFSLIQDKKSKPVTRGEGRNERKRCNDFTFNADLFVGSREKASRVTFPRNICERHLFSRSRPKLCGRSSNRWPLNTVIRVFANFISRIHESCLVTKSISIEFD